MKEKIHYFFFQKKSSNINSDAMVPFLVRIMTLQLALNDRDQSAGFFFFAEMLIFKSGYTLAEQTSSSSCHQELVLIGGNLVAPRCPAGM